MRFRWLIFWLVLFMCLFVLACRLVWGPPLEFGFWETYR